MRSCRCARAIRWRASARSTSTSCPRTTTGRRTPRRTSTTTPWPTARDSCSRSSSAWSAEPPGQRDGLVARGDLAGEAGLGDLGEQPPELRPRRDPKRAGELVTADQRRARRLVVEAQRRRQDQTGDVEVAGDRLIALVPPRGEPVGDREQRDVDLHRRGPDEVAVDRPAVQRRLVDEETQ